MRYDYPIQTTVLVTSSEQLAAVYAVLANPNLSDAVNLGMEIQRQSPVKAEPIPDPVEQTFQRKVESVEELTEAVSKSHNAASEPEIDSAGVPFDPELHTGTKKKDGTWRAKKGKADEAAALVEEVAEAEDEGNETAEAEISLAEPAAQTGNTPDAPSDEIDEFAAFKEAAAQVEEPVSVPERTWTDADLGQLCNDAAVKLGNPAPIKALIAKYVPEGEVPHSRNVPNDQREAFAQEVEAAAGIEYAG